MDTNPVTQEHLFGLVELAHEHQRSVQAAIDALTAERDTLRQASASLMAATARAVPAVQHAAEQAVLQALTGASMAAIERVSAAIQPLIASVTGVEKSAELAEQRLRRAVASFGWRHAGNWHSKENGITLVIPNGY